MQDTVPILGGGEEMAKDSLKFTGGDIIRKKKHHKSLIYFIADVAERGDFTKYKYFLYRNELFEHHKGSGWRRADYFDKRVETCGAESEWVDYEMGEFSHLGHIREQSALISIGHDTYYTIDLGQLNNVRSNGIESICSGHLFYETVGSERCISVHEVGWETDGLADDMLRLSAKGEGEKFVEHEKNIMEALNRGIWIPIKPTDSRIDGMKVQTI